MKSKEILLKPLRWINLHRKLAFYIFLALTFLALVLVIVIQAKQLLNEDEPKEIVIEETPIQIEDIRPKGQIYVCTAIIEDYTTLQREESHLMVFKKKHSCVQTLRQKCSFVLDLDKVEYIPDSGKHVLVRLPELEYVATSQKMPFLSDDDTYWAEALPNTNGLKQKVAKQIRKQFDTPSNRQKANRYAEKAISDLLGNIGYEVEFISKIEKKKE